MHWLHSFTHSHAVARSLINPTFTHWDSFVCWETFVRHHWAARSPSHLFQPLQQIHSLIYSGTHTLTHSFITQLRLELSPLLMFLDLFPKTHPQVTDMTDYHFIPTVHTAVLRSMRYDTFRITGHIYHCHMIAISVHATALISCLRLSGVIWAPSESHKSWPLNASALSPVYECRRWSGMSLRVHTVLDLRLDHNNPDFWKIVWDP